MKKIAFTGGGTGGHITPLLSMYNRLKDRNDLEFFWIGEKDSLEEKIAKENGIRFYPIKAGKLRRYFSFKTFIEPLNILSGILESKNILKKEKPDFIFSKGGHVSLPVAIASKMLGISLFLHESDTIPGLANRYVGKFAKKIFLGFEMASKYFDKSKTEVVGQILNPDLFEKNEKLEVANNKTNLLIIAGSQGSRRIFEEVLKNITVFNDFNVYVILGSLNISFKEEFEKYNNFKVYEFIDQKKLSSILDITDIAITRAGATSLAELEAFNIKLIVIPLKESANNHQYYNAYSYSVSNEAIMLTDDTLALIPLKIKGLINYKKTPGIIANHGALDNIINCLGL